MKIVLQNLFKKKETKMKRMLLVLMGIILLCSGLSAYSGGSGTSGDPYQIENLNDLAQLSAAGWPDWDKYFIQTADIDASPTVGWDGGQGFTPIGSWYGFEGSYDGQGHIIDGLFINRPSTSYIGLFTSTEWCTITNLGLTNVNITGYNEVGAFVGIHQGTMNNCYTTGVVNGSQQVGGLVGRNWTNSHIDNCYSLCSVYGTLETRGGLVGHNYHAYMNNCYAAGYVDGSHWSIGGLIGSNSGYAITDCFWDMETTNQASSAGGTGKTTALMKDVRTFTDVAWSAGLSSPWDFVDDPYDDNDSADIWNIDDMRVNNGYPFLTILFSPPDTPTNVVLTIVEDDVHLTWDEVPDVINYRIYRSEEPYPEDWGVYYGDTENNIYIDEGAALVGKYFYYITSRY